MASVALGDGRILQIEAATYGTSHRVGNPASAFLERFNAWLPRAVVSRLEPKSPLNVIGPLDHPALIIWVNAVDEKTGTNVDCQGIRVELVDETGQHFGETTSSWFGGQSFWRQGHIFNVYPRSESELTMQVTTWNQGKTNQVQFPNPHVVQPAPWAGTPLPQQKSDGDLQIVLANLRLRTNGLPPKYYTTRFVYWEPVWELRRGGEKLRGWDKPEWRAEDPAGNRGQELGTNQPVLRFSATFYPSATNMEVAQLVATMPQTVVTNLQSPTWWRQAAKYGTNDISILGLFPHGSYVFSEGVLLTNPPVAMGPVGGGAPSGWTWTSRNVNPIKEIHYSGHYSISNDIIYVSAPGLGRKTHLAIRLRDDDGHYRIAKLDPAGPDNGIYPFLVRLPTNVVRVTPELVALKPVEAEYTVAVPTNSAH